MNKKNNPPKEKLDVNTDQDLKNKKIKIHLVHGTWANGWFKSKTAWFNPDSVSYQRIIDQLPQDVQVEPFLWSGKNSVAARSKAASILRGHIEKSISNDPHTDHVILAHSHGGTVAVEALGGINQKSQGAPQIKALICLATPFAYLARPSFAQFQTGLLAVVSILYAIYWYYILRNLPWIPDFLGLYGFAFFIGIKALLAFFLVMSIVHALYEQVQVEPILWGSQPPIYLLRATRDEASLLIGFVQTFNWLSLVFARSHDITSSSFRRPVSYVGYAIAYLSCAGLGLKIATPLFSQIGLLWPDGALQVLVIGVYAPAIAGTVYLLGYTLLAFAVGHYNLLSWLTTSVEVDAAPPGRMCNLKVYSALPAGGLRHGLYEHEEVLKDVGTIVRDALQN